ncbi:DUF2141 domain-containing protein [Sphingomicrobium astaxanthinifaciens]|uniref:DUF2141 domain-containing protein n=1 Tax=Sphingomicrobium astaxanthinifaciens TaxID=1227949 RepID=UPI001FCC9A23|nr:DUF2141 domain-containing protein [Sphingomicrobium astaxanthinifaciens]MCJ7420810.1 DUF2141 domain-containing protein [Sphingomicrobium astaxanthinifaciens]
MSNKLFALHAAAACLVAGLVSAAPARAAGVYGDVDACDAGRPSVLVRVSGFKAQTGTLRLSLYDGNPDNWLVGGRKIHHLTVAVPPRGDVDLCVAVPRPGTYAFGLQHDLDGDKEIGRRDGGAFSNNASITLFDRKPEHDEVAFRVGNGTRRMGVRLLYLKGLSIGPWTR